MGCCGGIQCLRWTLFFTNAICWMVGAALLSVGIWMATESSSMTWMSNVLPEGVDQMFAAAYTLVIVIGAIIFLVAFLGFLGICMENTTLLYIYAVLLAVVLIGDVVVLTLALVARNMFGDFLKQRMYQQVQRIGAAVGARNNTAVSLAWNLLQYQLTCCGANGYTDYFDNPNFNPEQPVPFTCCRLANEDAYLPQPEDWLSCRTAAQNPNVDIENPDQLYTVGCYVVLAQWFRDKTNVLILAAFLLAVIQSCSVILACVVRSGTVKDPKYDKM